MPDRTPGRLSHLFSSPVLVMAATSGSCQVLGDAKGDEAHVTDLLGHLNLTKEEEEFVAFSDDEVVI